ncbi:MAG TPA: prepilin-type N-terminal cleavage/methylation domain-containing protein [Candidatus Acidoferrum sp.]|jgi:prepilin-type N-terminal cleavage/methylation domain-containing protein|nr:prepilin-type N-terminal cleavage/methylation domain-containing protein [Candidatus Acidoferrum sp.]
MNRNAARKAAFNKELVRSQTGFSLIELLIVVAIILIIAAIAIPNLMRARMAAHEATAAESVRTITTGETTYAAACPDIGYSATLVELNTGVLCAGGKNTIDDVLGASDPSYKGGYKITYAPTPSLGLNITFTVNAVPVAVGLSGQRGFFSDQTGVIRYTLDGTVPTSLSSALQ